MIKAKKLVAGSLSDIETSILIELQNIANIPFLSYSCKKGKPLGLVLVLVN